MEDYYKAGAGMEEKRKGQEDLEKWNTGRRRVRGKVWRELKALARNCPVESIVEAIWSTRRYRLKSNKSDVTDIFNWLYKRSTNPISIPEKIVYNLLTIVKLLKILEF